MRLTDRPVTVRYAELARALGVAARRRSRADSDVRAGGARRSARQRAWCWTRTIRDTYSAGSFFTNPILDADQAAAADAAIRTGSARTRVPRYPVYPRRAPTTIKLSAAWLIERAGFPQGLPGSRGAGRGVEQAHPGADQPRRQHGRPDRAGRGDPGRRPGGVRGGPAPGAAADRGRPAELDRAGLQSHPVENLGAITRLVTGNSRQSAYGGLIGQVVAQRRDITVRRTPIGGCVAAAAAAAHDVLLVIAGCAGSQDDEVVTVTSTAAPAVTVSGLDGSQAAGQLIDGAEQQGAGQRQAQVRHRPTSPLTIR